MRSSGRAPRSAAVLLRVAASGAAANSAAGVASTVSRASSRRSIPFGVRVTPGTGGLRPWGDAAPAKPTTEAAAGDVPLLRGRALRLSDDESDPMRALPSEALPKQSAAASYGEPAPSSSAASSSALGRRTAGRAEVTGTGRDAARSDGLVPGRGLARAPIAPTAIEAPTDAIAGADEPSRRGTRVEESELFLESCHVAAAADVAPNADSLQRWHASGRRLNSTRSTAFRRVNAHYGPRGVGVH